MDQDQTKALGERLGVSSTRDLGKYQGVPIINGRVTKQTHGYIIDRMKNKIKCLSMVGRLVLTQSVLSANSLYTMQTIMLPKTTYEEIDRVRR